MKAKTTLAIVFMTALMVAAMLPQAQAESEASSNVWLYDNGADGAANASTDWKFYVSMPSYLALDDSTGYWNFTVYGEMVNNTGRAATSTLKVKICIESEGVNKTAQSSMAVSKTAKVYGNISFTEAVYSGLPDNDSAAIYVLLGNGAGFTRNDSWASTMVIVTSGSTGMLVVMLPGLVGLVIIVAVVGFVGEVMTDATKSFGRSGSKKASKRRK